MICGFLGGCTYGHHNKVITKLDDAVEVFHDDVESGRQVMEILYTLFLGSQVCSLQHCRPSERDPRSTVAR